MQVAKVGLWHIVLTWLELEEKKQNVIAVTTDQFSYAWNTLRCNGTAALLA